MHFKKCLSLLFILVCNYSFPTFASERVHFNEKELEEKWETLKEQFHNFDKTISNFSDEDKVVLKNYFEEMARRRCDEQHCTEYTYYAVTAASIAMTVGAALNLPLASIVQLMGTSYFTNQVSFVLTHLRFHCDFIGEPINKMKHSSLFALLHHYFDTRSHPIMHPYSTRI